MSQQESSDVVEGEVVDEGAELAVRPESGMRAINIPEFRAWADSRAEALGILMEMGIAQTRAEDWSDQGGKPYPEQGACSAMVNMVGITISPPARRRENFEDELGHYYIYFLESEVTVPKFGIGPLPIVGRASSRDQFFAWKRDDAGEKMLRNPSEIDPGDILSKAYTNLRYRAVKAVVPQVANIGWDALRKLTAGRVAKGKVRQIHYGDSGEEAPAEGNCPTCGKGTLIEKKRSDGSGTFWVCSLGKWDPKTKTKSGCQHIQNDPPEAAPAPESAEQGDTPSEDPNGAQAEASGAQAVPRAAVATVLDILSELGSNAKQMTALAKAAKVCGLTISGSQPGKWLEAQTDEDLGRLLDVIEVAQ